jgi:hypothetical protein
MPMHEEIIELPSQPPAVVVHVFVHGTLIPGLSKEFLMRNQIMLEDGLVEISEESLQLWHQNKLPRSLQRRAAIHITAAYDHFVEKDGIINKYYVYSWAGILDNAYRQQEANKLYHQLAQLRDRLLKQYPQSSIKFILHGHSHGGNVILYLAYYENLYKQHLPISVACLLATPIQQETIQYVKNPLFETIIILYSDGDYIQNNDCFSSKKSYRRFSDLISLADAKNNIYEICACACQKNTAFGHAGFFWLFPHTLIRIHRGKRSHHQTLITLSPLPLIIFTPPLFKLLRQLPPEHGLIKWCLEADAKKCFFTLMYNQGYAISEDMLERVSNIKQTIKKNWK